MLAGKRRALLLARQPCIAVTGRAAMGVAVSSSKSANEAEAEVGSEAAEERPAGRLQRWSLGSDRRCTPSVPGVDEELATCDMWHALLSKEGYIRLNNFSGVRIRRWCSWRRQRQGTPPSAPAVWCSPDLEEDGDPWATPLQE
ncbi:rsmF [Symbiodinium sp. CCMP2456]|nr:rsmF [Symbiodinium sp. CCMP2456]